MKLSVFLLLFGFFEQCFAARILFFLPVASRSHYILHEQLEEELVKRGHEITIVAPYKKSNPIQNISEIIIPDTSHIMFNGLSSGNPSEGRFQMRNFRPLLVLKLIDIGKKFINEIMNDSEMQKFMKSDQKFDLVVGEGLMQEGLLAGLAYNFKAPMVMLCPLMPFGFLNEIAGNSAPLSYVPDVSLGLTDKMTFLERLINGVLTTLINIVYFQIIVPLQNDLLKHYLGPDVPDVRELVKNISLILINHHFSLAFPRPYTPNMVEIGGYHVRPPKPLPKDLQKFMDDATNGVIYFSMGTNLRSDEFPKEKFDGILKAFSRLEQKVLWKFEAENLENLPKNVKISKWLPQSDLLAHPNMKLFITHGGLLSITESVFRGVPVLGIPIFGDQPANVKLIVNLGMAVKLEFDDINEDNFYNSIQTILNDPKYSENAKLRSKLMQDRPLSPVDTAIYWLEYVIRYKGTPHLKSEAMDLKWYQLYMLDVLAFIGVILCLFIYCMKKILCYLVRKIKGGKQKETTLNKKRN